MPRKEQKREKGFHQMAGREEDDERDKDAKEEEEKKREEVDKQHY